jgi:hypothetical protein
MKTVRCEIWENRVTSFCDDLNDSDDDGVDFAFNDHDIDSFDYSEPEAEEYELCC